ncbi:MAG: hypothetical protein ABI647_23800 [Gemmatimonadota bacterium]
MPAMTRAAGLLAGPLTILVSMVAAQTGPEAIAPLPRPTGVHAIGTAILYLNHSARIDPQLPRGRPIIVQLWYPRTDKGGAGAARYLIEPGLSEALVKTQYYGIDPVSLAAWAAIDTHARLDAPVSPGKHPLVTLSVGLGVIRANYTTIAEELASQGYIVAAVENPLAGFMALPDGRVVSDTTSRLEDAAVMRTAVTDWSQDISFALDHLATSGVGREVAAAIDWARVGAAGHSSGGLVALETCQRDRRFRACVDMDGGFATPANEPMAEFVTGHLKRPTLMLREQPIYSDADFARRGLTREQWEKRGAGGSKAIDSVAARAQQPFHIVSVAGTGHFSFSDAPFVMPSAISRFGGKIIDPHRGWIVITTTLRGFFDEYLNRASQHSFVAVVRTMPELTARSNTPAGAAKR